MAEKKGDIEKLRFDFNTSGMLEIYMPTLKDWYRVTAKDFRSFDGERRITYPTEIKRGDVYCSTITQSYTGPVFMYGTNTKVPPTNQGKIVTSLFWEKALKISEGRR